MKSFANFWVLIMFSISGAYAGLDGTKIPNSVILNSNFSKAPTPNNVLNQDGIIKCDESGSNSFASGQLGLFAKRMGDISSSYICSQAIISKGRFTPDACNESISCKKSISEASSSKVQKLMDEITAKDFATNMLKYKTEGMDQFELLKRFAEVKYNIKNPKCGSSFKLPSKSNTCNLSLLNEAFVSYQESCTGPDACFNKTNSDYLSFKEYKKQNPLYETADILDYGEYRMEKQLTKLKEGDQALLDNLANLIMSQRFKSLTGEQRADLVLKELQSKNGDYYKDPFFEKYFGKISDKNVLKQSDTYKHMAKMLEKPFSSSDEFKAKYEEYRKMSASATLQGADSCSNRVDLKNICEEMTKISKGEKIFKNPLEVNLLSSKDLSAIEYEKLRNFLGNNLSKEMLNVVMNANRCITFQNGSEEKAASIALTSRNWYESVNETNSTALDIKEVTRTSLVNSKEQFDFGQTKEQSNEVSSPKNLAPETSENVKKFSAAIADTQKATNDFSNQFNRPYVPTNYRENEEAEVEGDNNDTKINKIGQKGNSAVTSPSSGSSPVDSTMSELMKRLEIAEGNVDKMKADLEIAENDRVKQKKIDEENALIKELRGQITDLKATKDKNEAVREIVTNGASVEQSRGQNNSFASSFNNSSASTPARQDTIPKTTDNFDSGRATDAASSASSANSRSVSSPMLTSTTNANNNNEGSKVLPSGVMLTTVDGMSLEKAIQTISKKIIELNGTPFYIEEGGMVKEIIAVVKDGKVLLDEKGNPIYEKIVKGKVGDKKYAVASDKKRAPAAITNVADLKRDQEEKLKRERAEYLKLKSLTNGVLNNK